MKRQRPLQTDIAVKLRNVGGTPTELYCGSVLVHAHDGGIDRDRIIVARGVRPSGREIVAYRPIASKNK